MEEAPLGYRRPEDEHLFKQPTSDRCITPDYVSPAVEGYFRIPAVWVGTVPDPETVQVLNPSIHHTIVYKRKLRSGIETRVQRDGTFLFDFSTWVSAPTIVIPGYKVDDPATTYRIPRETTIQEERAESFAVLRAQVMNAHQACLTTAETIVKRRAAAMGFPVTAWNTHKALSFDEVPSYDDDTEDIHALARNVLNNKDKIVRDHPFQRRMLELDVIDYSMSLLDDILISNDIVLIQMVEGAYIAACRHREKRFGEALILAWGVCEQLLNVVWKQLLDDMRTHKPGSERMPNDRRKKLTGRDYTASIMVEMLEINGQIDNKLYRMLEIARKARNDWAHEMQPPKERQVEICLQAVRSLLHQVKGVQLWLQPGGRGGVPQWAIWSWEEVKARGGP